MAKDKFAPNEPVHVKRTDSDIVKQIAFKKTQDPVYMKRHRLVVVDERLTGVPPIKPPPSKNDNRSIEEKVDDLKKKFEAEQKKKADKEKSEKAENEKAAESSEEKTGEEKDGDAWTESELKAKNKDSLKEIAKDLGLDIPSTANKSTIIKTILNG